MPPMIPETSLLTELSDDSQIAVRAVKETFLGEFYSGPEYLGIMTVEIFKNKFGPNLSNCHHIPSVYSELDIRGAKNGNGKMWALALAK